MNIKQILPEVRDQLNRSASVAYAMVRTPTGNVVVDMDAYSNGNPLPDECYEPQPRSERITVYQAIDKEREHQDAKYGVDKPQSIPGFLLIIENELNEAKAGWTKNLTGRSSVMHEICQIAATCVAAMERYGSTGSAIPTNDIPAP